MRSSYNMTMISPSGRPMQYIAWMNGYPMTSFYFWNPPTAGLCLGLNSTMFQRHLLVCIGSFHYSYLKMYAAQFGGETLEVYPTGHRIQVDWGRD